MFLAGSSKIRGLRVVYGWFDSASHVAVYYWVQKLRGLIHSCRSKFRRVIAVDEIKLKLNGEYLFVWES